MYIAYFLAGHRKLVSDDALMMRMRNYIDRRPTEELTVMQKFMPYFLHQGQGLT